MSYIPASVRLMLMSLPSSRRQRTVNGRVPVALQVRVTELCSRAVTSELLSASSILGGTKEMIMTPKEKEKIIHRVIRSFTPNLLLMLCK